MCKTFYSFWLPFLLLVHFLFSCLFLIQLAYFFVQPSLVSPFMFIFSYSRLLLSVRPRVSHIYKINRAREEMRKQRNWNLIRNIFSIIFCIIFSIPKLKIQNSWKKEIIVAYSYWNMYVCADKAILTLGPLFFFPCLLTCCVVVMCLGTFYCIKDIL